MHALFVCVCASLSVLSLSLTVSVSHPLDSSLCFHTVSVVLFRPLLWNSAVLGLIIWVVLLLVMFTSVDGLQPFYSVLINICCCSVITADIDFLLRPKSCNVVQDSWIKSVREITSSDFSKYDTFKVLFLWKGKNIQYLFWQFSIKGPVCKILVKVIYWQKLNINQSKWCFHKSVSSELYELLFSLL